MPSNNLYGFPQPLTQVFPAPIIAARAPTTADYQYPLGQEWVDSVGQNAYILVNVTANVATWAEQGGVSGPVDTLTGDSGGAIGPTGGTINVLGTANQITTTGSGHTITWSLPATVIAPGSVEVTSGFSVDAGAVTIASGTSAINISADAAATTVNFATGAAVKTLTIGSTSSTSATNIRSGSGGIGLTGAVTSANAITITAGDLTATLGNLIINGAAKQLRCHGGAATDFIGQATLVNGTATVLNTNIAATDRIFLQRSAVNASSALGVFKSVISASTNFVITACKPADATTETGDVSTVDYFIVRQV